MFWCPVRRSVRTLTHGRTHEQARQKGSVEVRLRCDSMDLAGEVVQDLGRFLKVIRPINLTFFKARGFSGQYKMKEPHGLEKT